MTPAPVIGFGQQPCGIFPKRFLIAKIATARRLHAEIGGRIVFFYHDSDHDPRETQTLLRHRKTGEPHTLNFAFENKLQRKFSPLYLKRVSPAWCDNTARQLPAYVDDRCIDAFLQTVAIADFINNSIDNSVASTARPPAANVADLCLKMYRALGLLDGIEIVRSSSPDVRRSACDITDFFVDVPYDGEIVRARHNHGALQLHEGGDTFLTLPPPAMPWEKSQISPTRDTRLRWMQSVLGCTHYIAGPGEQAYLHKHEAPEILFVNRDPIDRPDEAHTDAPA